MIFTNLLYGWMALSALTLTGETWYASPPTRWQIRTIDEVEILLGQAERCLGAGITPLSYVASLRDTNGFVTMTNTLVWQLDGRMLRANDVHIKLAAPSYVQTNTVTNYSPDLTPWTFTGLVAELGIDFSEFGWPILYTNYEDRYKVENLMEWTHRDATVTNMDYWRGYGSTSITNGGSLAYTRAVDNYSLQWSGPSNVTLLQDCSKSYTLETNSAGNDFRACPNRPAGYNEQ